MRNCIFFYIAVDDFTTMGGSLSQYAASFGNSWKVPDQKNEVTPACDFSRGTVYDVESFQVTQRSIHRDLTTIKLFKHTCCVVPQGCDDAAELGHSCDVSADSALRRQAQSECHRLLENPFTHCHSRVRQTRHSTR